MLKRLKSIGFLLVLFFIGFLFYATPIGKILGHKSLFYVGLVLILVCFLGAVKIVGTPPQVADLVEKIKKHKR